jgi:hypothetical protein
LAELEIGFEIGLEIGLLDVFDIGRVELELELELDDDLIGGFDDDFELDEDGFEIGLLVIFFGRSSSSSDPELNSISEPARA